ncbi:MAG: shikimate dehydrogenase [Promethearchaeota archaeon]|nr:MAG: shikimate dehydrogenase [Candidatus Lokiarchaeota archaeon]
MENFNIDSQTSVLGLIGHPVEHSMSPIMHNAIIQKLNLKYVYLAFDVDPKNLKKAMSGIRGLNIKGINVTIPYKQQIMNFVDEIDPLAKKIGAINAIKNIDGYLIARNTDAAGAKKSLIDAKCKLQGKNILVLGAGGASRAISFALADEANKIIISNRTEDKAITLAKEIKNKMNTDAEGYSNQKNILEKLIENVDILINTTPLGMYPNTNKIPLPEHLLIKNLFVFDVIYNPLKTKLLKVAEKKGCNILGGLDMLVNQGALAFEWWTGKEADKNLMKTKITKYLEAKNVR